jgi:hypothetical protein
VAFEVAAYNPERDSDGRGARTIIELVAAALGARIESQTATAVADASSATVADSSATAVADRAAMPKTSAPVDTPTDDSSAHDSPEQATSASSE